LGKQCKYNRPEGFSPYDSLKKEVEELTRDIQELRKTNDALRKQVNAHLAVMNMLRYSSDNEAAGLLARLRIGESIDGIVCHHSSMVGSGLRDNGLHREID
jgi:chromosome segregation ATPase